MYCLLNNYLKTGRKFTSNLVPFLYCMERTTETCNDDLTAPVMQRICISKPSAHYTTRVLMFMPTGTKVVLCPATDKLDTWASKLERHRNKPAGVVCELASCWALNETEAHGEEISLLIGFILWTICLPQPHGLWSSSWIWHRPIQITVCSSLLVKHTTLVLVLDQNLLFSLSLVNLSK